MRRFQILRSTNFGLPIFGQIKKFYYKNDPFELNLLVHIYFIQVKLFNNKKYGFNNESKVKHFYLKNVKVNFVAKFFAFNTNL